MRHVPFVLLLVIVPLTEAAAQRRTSELVCTWRDQMRSGMRGTCRSFRVAGAHHIGRACSCTTARGVRMGRIVERPRAPRTYRAPRAR